MPTPSDAPHMQDGSAPTAWTAQCLLPEAPGAPLSPDRGGYTLTMREDHGAHAVLAHLTDTRPSTAGTLHVGWGSFRNFDIVAARRSSHVLLLDVNLHQLRVWQAVEQAICLPEVSDAASFVEAVLPLLPTSPRLRQFLVSTRDWLLSDLQRPCSWLCASQPAHFQWVQDLFLSGRVAVGCLDMRGGAVPGAFEDLTHRLQQAQVLHGIQPDTLYVSNLPWMLSQPLGFFGEPHAAHLPSTTEDAVAQVRRNLALLAPLFDQVVSAGRLSPQALPDSLQWQTECMPPEAFLDQAYWASLACMLEPQPGCNQGGNA